MPIFLELMQTKNPSRDYFYKTNWKKQKHHYFKYNEKEIVSKSSFFNGCSVSETFFVNVIQKLFKLTFKKKLTKMIFLADVNECDTNPCGANGVCSESRQGLAVSDSRLSFLEGLR